MSSSPPRQDALGATDQSYRTIFDYSNDAIFVHDLATGAIVDANRVACELSGATREELLTRGLDIIGNGPPPYTAELALGYIQRAAAGEEQRFEWCSTHPRTGEEVWVEVGLQRVKLAGQDRLLALVRDIRERKKAERALRASEEAYRTIFKHSSEGIWVHDVETGEMLDVNQAGCDLYGYTFDEMMSLGHDALNFPDSEYDAERVAQYMARTTAGESSRFEWMGRHKDGSPVWGEVTLRRVTVSGKDRILATVRDIKDRKRAEQALRRANEELECRVAERTEELRRSEEHFRRLIENGNDYIMVVDETAAIEYIGPSVKRILGYTPEEMMGLRPSDLVHPDDVAAVLATLDRIVKNPGETFSQEFRIKHRTGTGRTSRTRGARSRRRRWRRASSRTAATSASAARPKKRSATRRRQPSERTRRRASS
jgi:PAS domain S-box-containing protein